ncbi:hypothetical protein I3843_05G218800 [Carya illinoinensis]|uniref:Uncharacterized protein n=1 Tax=Carya illinoinensis TaxID=32201 RepID=A0A922JSA0_CARIL|nr:hypothetical protein I3760_05G240100 [Carya illinoinensis]KAG6715149.1 hypothetical protein I3842_05G236500 [Carya illinoinensis]KAG7981164.1 hypothetical protein I3843_05G218800 [Carya illinoinensis]
MILALGLSLSLFLTKQTSKMSGGHWQGFVELGGGVEGSGSRGRGLWQHCREWFFCKYG